MRNLLILCLFSAGPLFGQTTKKVCFLGNSYVYTNDLPGMIQSMATADGNTLVKDQNAPGGYTLSGHASNTTSISKIAADSWDFVVLQDQSQLPSFPWSQVSTDVLPYARILCDTIRYFNSCSVPLFFDTWGRLNGDPQWDSINTFDKMNQRLFNTYTYMADEHSGQLAPVGIAFDHIHNDGAPVVTHSQLYSGDGSHPTAYGTYLAACIFYEVIFDQNSQGNTYLPAGMLVTEAQYLQDVAHHVLSAVDSVDTDFTQPIANFAFNTNGTEVTFTNQSTHSFSWMWDFDGQSNSTDEHPTHDFGSNGTYAITLSASYCGKSDDTTAVININGAGIDAPTETFGVYPNPVLGGHPMHIQYNGQLQIATLYSLDGEQVASIQLNQAVAPEVAKGIYLLRIGEQQIRLLIE